MKIDVTDFAAQPRRKVKLKEWPTRIKPFYESEEHYRKTLAQHVKQLSAMQDLLYAHNRYAVAADIPGDGRRRQGQRDQTRHVGRQPAGVPGVQFQATERARNWPMIFSGARPAACRSGATSASSTAPTTNRFWWCGSTRKSCRTRGCRTNCWPGKDIWKHRFQSIVDFEKHLHRNGTRVLKFFLHISKSEQKRRFLKRIDEPEKNWKFSMADMRERKLWKPYAKAYEACLSATSSEEAPWFIVPGDDKPNARLIISQVVVEAVKSLKMGSLQPAQERRKELQEIRKVLVAE